MENNMEMIENVVENIGEVTESNGKTVTGAPAIILAGAIGYGIGKGIEALVKFARNRRAARKAKKEAEAKPVVDAPQQPAEEDFDINQPIDAK